MRSLTRSLVRNKSRPMSSPTANNVKRHDKGSQGGHERLPQAVVDDTTVAMPGQLLQDLVLFPSPQYRKDAGGHTTYTSKVAEERLDRVCLLLFRRKDKYEGLGGGGEYRYYI